jgi:heavy metal sensor kinase
MRLPPIRVRLTAWYLVVIFLSLALYSIGTYFSLRRAIEDTVDHQLQVRSDNIAQFVKTNAVQQAANSPQLLPKASGLEPGDELYQVTDASGAIVYQSSAMRDLDVPLDTTRLRHHYRHYRDNGDFTTYYHRQGDVRVLASKVEAGSNEYGIQVATIVSPLYDVLDTFRVWAWTGLPLIVCVAGFGGYWLSGRAMKPVHNLVLSTRAISERSLSKRIQVTEAQDELRELGDTINAMLDRLESAFTRITRFTSDASHELRTPITVIRTTSEVILEKERSIAQYKEMVGQILRESESTSALIEQLLTLARADADTEQVSLENTDLRALVEELELSSRALAESHNIHWSVEIPNEPIVVLGDRSYLRRLLLILIDNACRYTEKGGSVRLRLAAQQDEAILEVTDTGIGIPFDELTHIFDRFYRASNARFFDPDGTGLGLAIAHWITTAHGGTLTAQSTVGSGTSMLVRLQTTAADQRPPSKKPDSLKRPWRLA